MTTPEPARPDTPAHEPPEGASTTATWNGLGYTSTARWLVLRKGEKPAAEVFSVSYVADGGAPDRPVTFVFNGGPGASSAYLHLGAVGPRRVDFPGDGTMPAAPPRLVDNNESWLAFTDLVFVDPVGTGFSRVVEEKGGAAKDGDAKKEDTVAADAYFGTDRDLDAMCEFIGRWLSGNGRWTSPVFLAGESYGGYRVGRLTRRLQETTGVGLSGAILISPALEFAGLAAIGFDHGDYEVLPWVDILPTMALAAAHHGRSRAFPPGTPSDEVRRAAEEFATGEYASFLTRGAAMAAEDRQRVVGRLADLTGLDPAYVARAEGRVRVFQFTRELLRADRRVLGMYDATLTTADPYPDRDLFMGGDPSLTGIAPVFTAAVNQHLRVDVGVRTDREYKLLNPDIIGAWKDDAPGAYNHPTRGATDDFRAGMALNPHMRAFITHGHHDLVTPYYTTDRLRNLMRLDPTVASRLTVRHVDGGHMFYAWTDSRRALTSSIRDFVSEATAR